jgi:APA family basic amino acid/polyamine antiporter
MITPRTDGPAARTSLLPVLGLFFGIAVSIGSTLGVGILRQPGPVASYLRQPWLIMLMWFAGAVYAALGASNVSELATMLPREGGFYVYARAAMGERAGFAVGWSDFLANVAPAAYAAMAAVEFIRRLVPAIAPFAQVTAAGAILTFAAMQWFGVRLSARVQQAASALAALALAGLVVGCFMARTPAAAPPPASGTGSFIGPLVLAIQSIVVTYDGWYSPIYFAEETRHATRQLPRAMFGGLALVAAIYLLLNAAFLHALGGAGLAASKFAAADAARRVFGRASEIVISVVAVVILLTLLVLAGSLAFLVGAAVSDRRNSLYALLLLMASFPVRWMLRASR